MPKATASEALDKFCQKLAADAALNGKVMITEFERDHYDIAPAGSADVVVTFRNLHDWLADGYAEEALAAFFKALKPGGVLCIEDHRGRDALSQDPRATTCYVRQDYAIALAKKAGFELAVRDQRRPLRTRDWP